MPILIPLKEPVNPRYIHINSTTNMVHILMPVVSGTEIGLDNTCRAVYALQEFFGESMDDKQVTILSELKRYQEALIFDITVIPDSMMTLKGQKQERLKQINAYIELIKKLEAGACLNTLNRLFPEYPAPLQALMSETKTNLFSMVLSPMEQDTYLRSVNPVFSVNHDVHDELGDIQRRVSILQQSLFNAFASTTFPVQNEMARIKALVLALVGDAPDFAKVQSVLGEKINALCGLPLNTYQEKYGVPISLESINALMGVELTTNNDYVDTLINYCTPELFNSLLASPFDTIRPFEEKKAKTAESLSVITQFFLASVNIHSRAEDLSAANFGEILDKSQELSREIAARVISAMMTNSNVEDGLFDFFNEHLKEFELNRALNAEEMACIKKKFRDNYVTIKESPHFDEFMLLYATKPGKFVSHQGNICTDICEFAAKIENTLFVQHNCRDFENMPRAILPSDKSIVGGEVEVSIERLLELSDEHFELLPTSAKDACRAHPAFKVRLFLNFVAKATPDKRDKTLIKTEAEALLKAATPADRQTLLRTPGVFTDYSGRTFNCTAFEYVYWAKDIYMCKMLLSYMDDETKVELLARINVIEGADAALGQLFGLSYQQAGIRYRSPHFDLTPLKTALQVYVDGFDAWRAARNWDTMEAAWLAVGKAQRELPVHVVNEYCRKDRTFKPTPLFNDGAPPRALQFYNFIIDDDKAVLFPLMASNSGLGFDFALVGWWDRGGWRRVLGGVAALDLSAVKRLDEVRTVDLMRLREDLNPPASTQSSCMRMYS